VMESADIVVLRELYRNTKMDIFEFHRLYSLSPGQLAQTLNKFVKQGIVEIEGDFAQITDFGRKWIVANRKSLFLEVRALGWKSIPDYMQKPRIPINSFYAPRKSLLDKEFFIHLIERKG
jgi:DNA-binding PadR family transcriptional regulator